MTTDKTELLFQKKLLANTEKNLQKSKDLEVQLLLSEQAERIRAAIADLQPNKNPHTGSTFSSFLKEEKIKPKKKAPKKKLERRRGKR